MKRTLSIIALCSAAFFATLGPASLAVAGEVQDSGDASSRDRSDLKTEWSQLKTQLGKLRSKVEDDSKEIQSLSDPKKTQERVAGLQADISEALSETADNGKIASLARKVVDTTKGWLADAKGHGFSQEREAFLEDKFNKIIGNAEQTIVDKTAIRRELTSTLQKIQNDGDYLEALARADQGE